VEVRRADRHFTLNILLTPPPGAFLEFGSLYRAQPALQETLNVGLPFGIKIVVVSSLSRAVPDPWGEDEDQEELTETTWSFPEMTVHVGTDERRVHFIVAAFRQRYLDRLEMANSRGSGWTFVGFVRLALSVTPGRALANLPPAPAPPVPAPGGCFGCVLPRGLQGHNKMRGLWTPQNKDQCCFMWCVLFHCHGGAEPGYDRLHTQRCTGRPFFTTAAPPRRLRRDDPPRQLQDLGLAFSGLPDGPVGLEHLEDFEQANGGRVHVYVYTWSRTEVGAGGVRQRGASARAAAAQRRARAAPIYILFLWSKIMILLF
jgi:hypothetical protein